MDKTKPRVGVAGVGRWGKNIIRNLWEIGVATAVYDPDPDRLGAALKGRTGLVAAESYNDLLRQVDAVAIASPAVMHFAMSREALVRGKHVFVEKPAALHLDQVQELADLARRQGVTFMTGHLLEYHPGVERMREVVGSGEIGKVQYIYSSRLNLGVVRTEENILWSFAPHDVSVLLRIMGEEPENVSAHAAAYISPGVYDVTVTFMNFASGARAHIFVSWLHPYKEQRFVVVGDHGMVVFDPMDKHSPLTLYKHEIRWVQRVPVAQKKDGIPLEFDDIEPLRREMEAFVHAVTTGTPPLTDSRDALRVMRVLDAAERSLAAHGAPVSLDTHATPYFVHESAYVDKDVHIGRGTKVWHFCHVMGHSSIGEDCVLGQNVFVADHVTIGNHVKLENDVNVFRGVTLEDGVFVGPAATFTNVTTPRSFVNRKGEYTPTLVRRGATIGANATIVCGVTLDEYAFVAAGAVVTHDVKPFQMVAGVPARPHGWACKCGVSLDLPLQAGDEPIVTQCPSCGSRYVLKGDTLKPAGKYADHP